VETNDARFTRRRLLAAGAGLALGASGGGFLWQRAAGAEAASALPPPGSTGLEHVVVVMMENRSFDHLLGWLAGANGKQAGLTYPTPKGGRASTDHLTDFQGCGHPDPDHSFEGGRTELDGGAADGWLPDTANDEYAIGYYTQRDLPFLGKAALPGLSATTTSPRSWARPIPTGSISTPARPTVSGTRRRPARCRRSGTG
jgi:phospholipase C